jgi:hypothetical protein
MAASIEPVETVTLRGGRSVSLDAMRVLWDLEDRGFTVFTSSAGLIVRPTGRITLDDDARIRRYRDELVALVRDCEAIQ